MFRYALVTYFLATTLAGPSLCFCTMMRLAVSAFQGCGQLASDTIPPTCCVSHAKENGNYPASTFPGSESNSPGKKCPCQEHVSENPSFFVFEVKWCPDIPSTAFELPSLDSNLGPFYWHDSYRHCS
jgi:hypothetical protein